MAWLKLNRALVIAGTRYDAGDVVEYDGEDAGYLTANGFTEETTAPVPVAPAATTAPARRTKAQIAADVAAAQAAEEQLQKDLAQAE